MILPFSKPVKLGQYEDTILKGPKNASMPGSCPNKFPAAYTLYAILLTFAACRKFWIK
jgi:hypothetical protein